MAAVRLAVTGMTCDHCCATVQGALEAANGVCGVYVDLPGGAADVDCDERIGRVDSLIAAVEAAGYRARAVS